MRTTSKLFLLAASVIVAMALGASSASATSAITVKVESTGANCVPATCTVHVVGESRLEAGTTVISRCQDEFDAAFNANGTGNVINQDLRVHPLGACNSVPCTTGGVKNPWPITNAEETGAGTIEAIVQFCLGAGTICNADVIITEPTTHNYNFSTNTLCPSGVRVIGNWNVEATNPRIEIQH